jgi:chromosome segregation ATPase
MKVAIVILIALSLGLGVALLYRHNQAVKTQRYDLAEKAALTNKLNETQEKLEEQERIAMYLQTNLTLTTQERDAISNHLIKVNSDLARTQQDAQAAAEAAKAEMAKREARIAELETQGNDLTKKIDGLNVAMANLSKQIAETESKLAASEGDRDFLLKELKRLQTEKAELERQFNDLSLLRTQVAKLKEELSIARRLEWIRSGIYGSQARKGAELLLAPTLAAAAARSNFNLNVELRQDGSAIVVPPTNAPPKPPPVTPPPQR